MKTLNELRSLQENGKMDILSIRDAEMLKGKKISTLYYGYRGQDGVDNFTVGEVISEFDYYSRDTDVEGFANRAEYWQSYMTSSQIREKQNTYLLFAADGRNTFMKAHPFNDGCFTCSDSDRFVFFLIDEENETN